MPGWNFVLLVSGSDIHSDDMVKQIWWKLLGVVLVLYSFVAGLLIPLGPGITGVHPSRAQNGDAVAIDITGYNTHFTESDTRAWLKLSDRHALEAESIKADGRRHVTAFFSIPESFPGQDTINVLSLIVYNDRDGHAILPSAVFVRGNVADKSDLDRWNQPVEQLTSPASFHFPFRNILAETIRNTYYHVVLWFAMMVILAISMLQSVRYLRTRSFLADHKAAAFATTGTFLGILGVVTGAIWAKHTWGAYWSFDVKQNMSAIALLIYAAYFILRSSMTDPDVARRFSAVYNIFAFIMLIPLLYIIPRMTDSLHPGSGGNPAFGSEDLDNTMRMVFYPAIIGWILLGCWLANLTWRYFRLYDEL